jgi:hypothetical protein
MLFTLAHKDVTVVVKLNLVPDRFERFLHPAVSFPCHFQNLPIKKFNMLKYVNICAMTAVAPIQFGGRPNNILANRAYVKPITSEHRKE